MKRRVMLLSVILGNKSLPKNYCQGQMRPMKSDLRRFSPPVIPGNSALTAIMVFHGGTVGGERFASDRSPAEHEGEGRGSDEHRGTVILV